MAGIELEAVTKVYRDGTVAVEDLDLRIEDGELFVFLGPSGCGKTTILRLVAGLETPTEGRILIGGRDVTDDPTPRRDVAMVFQNLALYPHLNVYDNIAFGVRMRRLKKAEVDARVRRAVATLGLEDVVRKRPRSLSGGQRQRVAMGRAIIREPNAFLMDEPLSDLDARLRDEMRTELSRIQRDVRVTTLYVTHDQGEAMALGDRVGVLRHGVLQQVEAPRAIYERPANLFVAAFLGSPPMNLAEATIDLDGGGDVVLIFGGQRVRVDEESLVGRPLLLDHVRRQVVIGIRPEDLREASPDTPLDRRLRAPVARVHTSGSETYAQFVMDAPQPLEEDPGDEGAGDEDVLDGFPPLAGINMWTARAGAGARVGDVLELAMQRGRLYAFDPGTGATIER